MPVNIRFTPILPKDKRYPLSVFEKLQVEFVDLLLDKIGPDIQNEYEKQVEGWSEPPEFPIKAVRGNVIGVEIIPKGRGLKKWIYVNKGTRSRRIRSRGKGPMVFPENYIPKTTPGGRYGGPGQKHGEIVRTHLVKDHSIAPREFEQKILTGAKVRQIQRQIQDVVHRVVNKYS